MALNLVATISVRSENGIAGGVLRRLKGDLAFFAVDNELEPGSRIELRIELTGMENTLYAEARVLRVRPSSDQRFLCRARLENLSRRDRQLLEEWRESLAHGGTAASSSVLESLPGSFSTARSDGSTSDPERQKRIRENLRRFDSRHTDSRTPVSDAWGISTTPSDTRPGVGREAVRRALRKSLARAKTDAKAESGSPSPSSTEHPSRRRSKPKPTDPPAKATDRGRSPGPPPTSSTKAGSSGPAPPEPPPPSQAASGFSKPPPPDRHKDSATTGRYRNPGTASDPSPFATNTVSEVTRQRPSGVERLRRRKEELRRRERISDPGPHSDHQGRSGHRDRSKRREDAPLSDPGSETSLPPEIAARRRSSPTSSLDSELTVSSVINEATGRSHLPGESPAWSKPPAPTGEPEGPQVHLDLTSVPPQLEVRYEDRLAFKNDYQQYLRNRAIFIRNANEKPSSQQEIHVTIELPTGLRISAHGVVVVHLSNGYGISLDLDEEAFFCLGGAFMMM